VKKLVAIIPAIRPPFLILAPICVMYGAAIAHIDGFNMNYATLILATVGAVLSLISVNTLNEYQDNDSKLDHQTKKTPFSGGSGLLQKQPELAPTVLALSLFSSLITFLIGCYFVYLVGLHIIPIGLIGLVIIRLYTSQLNKHAFICLISPGVGLGILTPLGSYYVLTGELYSANMLLILVPFFLINNLLLLNQYPDIQADQNAGRNHFPIRFGLKTSNNVYILSALLAILTLAIAIVTTHLPSLLLIAVLPILLSFYSLAGMVTLQEHIGEQPKYLVSNAISANLTPIIITVILFNTSPL